MALASPRAFPGLCSAAADHCREQAGGAVRHHSCDGSDPASNAFNPNYNAGRAAYGPHAKYGGVGSIDFASGYAERAFVGARTDAANPFQ